MYQLVGVDELCICIHLVDHIVTSVHSFVSFCYAQFSKCKLFKMLTYLRSQFAYT